MSSLAIRSLPPAIWSLRPYSSSDHSRGTPTSRKVWLKAGRWPYRSVSASTPSQSKMIGAHAHAFPSLPKRRMWYRATSITAARWALKIAGGSYSPGCALMYS